MCLKVFKWLLYAISKKKKKKKRYFMHVNSKIMKILQNAILPVAI